MSKAVVAVVLACGLVVAVTALLARRGLHAPIASQEGERMAPPHDGGPPDQRPEFVCRRCGQRHKEGEIGFKWPDAVYALDLTEGERTEAQRGDNEDVAVVRGTSFFVRGWAPLPVHGQTEPFGIGFWIQLSPDNFRDFQRKGRQNHPNYAGRIANQSTYFAPTLGLPARMEHRGVNLRPVVTLLGDHPLARAQKNGIDQSTRLEWMEEMVHGGELQPPGEPFTASLAKHGWQVMAPAGLGRVAMTFTKPPTVGDNLKVLMQFTAADAKGDPVPLTAGWWLRLDDSSRPELWSGRLANNPRVPAAISLGSRVWFSPSQVIEHEAVAQDKQP